jgi:hypothetical protein
MEFVARQQAALSTPGAATPVPSICHCVWHPFAFCLWFRDVQEMMLEHGVDGSHEGTPSLARN